MEKTEVYESYYDDTREILIEAIKCKIHKQDKKYFCLNCSIPICKSCIETHEKEENFILTTNVLYNSTTVHLEAQLYTIRQNLLSKITSICDSALDTFITKELSSVDSSSHVDASSLKINKLNAINKAIDRDVLGYALTNVFGDTLGEDRDELNVAFCDKLIESDVFEKTNGNVVVKLNVDNISKAMCYHCKKVKESPRGHGLCEVCFLRTDFLRDCRRCGNKFMPGRHFYVKCNDCFYPK
jgi:hypothetical protein